MKSKLGRLKKVLILLYICWGCSSPQNEAHRPYDKDASDENFISAIAEDIEFGIKSENEVINLKLPLQEVISGEPVLLGELTKQYNNALFFYFSQVHCNQCVYNEFNFIKQFYKKEDVVIIGKEKSMRMLQILKKNEGIQNPVYWMNMTETFDISFEKLSRPVFFRLNKGGNPYNIYSPKFSYPKLSEAFHRAARP